MNGSLVMGLESDLAFGLIRHNEKFHDLQTYEDGRWLGRLNANTSHYLVGLILASPEMQAIRQVLKRLAWDNAACVIDDHVSHELRLYDLPESVIEWVME